MNSPFKIHLNIERPSVASNNTKKATSQKPFKKEVTNNRSFDENLLHFFKENQPLLQELIQEEEETIAGVEMPYSSALSAHLNAASTSSAERPQAIDALFETMVSEVQFLHASGDSKTTFFLNGAEFAGSPFFGSQILIEEFSTAPKMFNITFVSGPQGASLFHMQIAALAQHFKQKDLPFSVHRLEVELAKEEESLWLSKERDNSDKEEQDA